MLFIVQFEDVYAEQPERLPERALHMPAHLAYLAAQGERLVAAGALREAEDSAPLGGLWIVEAADTAGVRALCEADPFWRAGLRRSVRISHWAKAHWSERFARCLAGVG